METIFILPIIMLVMVKLVGVIVRNKLEKSGIYPYLPLFTPIQTNSFRPE